MENKDLLGFWRHYKGNVYEVIGIGTHSETLLPMVIYRSVKKSDEIWVRPLSMWEEAVTVDGVTQTRFTRIEKG